MSKHTHVRTILKHANGRPYNENIRVTNRNPHSSMADIIVSQTWSAYEIKFNADFDGDTAYYRIDGLMKDGLRLTAHVFSCYCEPLNEDQEPPF